MRKPKVITRCVADQYSGPNEKIIEISDGRGSGALISIVKSDDGLSLAVYRRDRCEVIVGEGAGK